MIEVAIVGVGFSILLTFIRLIKGPTVPDRIIATNTIGLMFFSIIVLLSFVEGVVYLDVALVYAILLFVDVLVMVKYLDRKDGRCQ